MCSNIIELFYYRPFSNSQQCCYDHNGHLLTGIGGGAPYSVYPNNWQSLLGKLERKLICNTCVSILGYMIHDIAPFYLCCYGKFKSCNRYYNLRPNDNCREWPNRPPPSKCNNNYYNTQIHGLIVLSIIMS